MMPRNSRTLAWSSAVSLGGIVLLTASMSAGEVADSTELPTALKGTSWRLVDFQSMDDAVGTLRPDPGSIYTMRLGDDGIVTMHLNCNQGSGTWTAKSGKDAQSGRFHFGPLAMTRMHCPPPSMDDRIARDTRYVRSYLLKDGKLYLSLMADGGIYAWEPDTDEGPDAAIPVNPEVGGPRDWVVSVGSCRLNLRAEPSSSAAILTQYADGTILDNLGCRRVNGQIWCDVQQLGGGPRGYVAFEYLKPAVSPDGTVARGPDDSSLRAGQGKFDATGYLPCATAAGQPMGQCEFGVARAGGGYATVVITRPDGGTRMIYFRMGRPISSSSSEAEGYPEFGATRKGDLNIIHVGEERYEIPDVVVVGD